jgi:hypothetical protein
MQHLMSELLHAKAPYTKRPKGKDATSIGIELIS